MTTTTVDPSTPQASLGRLRDLRQEVARWRQREHDTADKHKAAKLQLAQAAGQSQRQGTATQKKMSRHHDVYINHP